MASLHSTWQSWTNWLLRSLTYSIPKKKDDGEDISLWTFIERDGAIETNRGNVDMASRLHLVTKGSSLIECTLASGQKVLFPKILLKDLERCFDDQTLFIEDKQQQPLKSEENPAPVIQKLYDLVGQDETTLQTVSQILSQQGLLYLKNESEEEFKKEYGFIPFIGSSSIQSSRKIENNKGKVLVTYTLTGTISGKAEENGVDIFDKAWGKFETTSSFYLDDAKKGDIFTKHVFTKASEQILNVPTGTDRKQTEGGEEKER
jgi:hypothetical protein